MEDFKYKYLKYKIKYVNLKSQIGYGKKGKTAARKAAREAKLAETERVRAAATARKKEEAEKILKSRATAAARRDNIMIQAEKGPDESLALLKSKNLEVIMPRFHSCNTVNEKKVPENVLIVTTSSCGKTTSWSNKDNLFYNPINNKLLLDPMKNKTEIEKILDQKINFHYSLFQGKIGTVYQETYSDIEFYHPMFYIKTEPNTFGCSGIINLETILNAFKNKTFDCKTKELQDRDKKYYITPEDVEETFKYSSIPFNYIADGMREIFSKEVEAGKTLRNSMEAQEFYKFYVKQNLKIHKNQYTTTLSLLISEMLKKYPSKNIIIYFTSCRSLCYKMVHEDLIPTRQNSLEAHIDYILSQSEDGISKDRSVIAQEIKEENPERYDFSKYP